MFEGRQEALQHRDAVLEAFIEEFGEDQEAMQISPVLDGCTLRVAEVDPEAVEQHLESEGFTVKMIGEGPDGDWFEMKVKP